MRKLYPVSVSCEVLEVSASGYFNWLRRRESGHGGPARRHSDEALLAHIRAIHAEVKGEYGWPRMHKELLARGIRVGKDRVRKLMQQHGIKARTKRKFVVTIDSRHSLPVAPDLLVAANFPGSTRKTTPESKACMQSSASASFTRIELGRKPAMSYCRFGALQ
jgi:putative transposase